MDLWKGKVDMNLKSYFDNELKVALVFAALGAIVGYASFLINSAPFSFLVMAVIGAVFMTLAKKLMKIAEDMKWWAGNGLVVYVFMWLIVWAIFYNVALR